MAKQPLTKSADWFIDKRKEAINDPRPQQNIQEFQKQDNDSPSRHLFSQPWQKSPAAQPSLPRVSKLIS